MHIPPVGKPIHFPGLGLPFLATLSQFRDTGRWLGTSFSWVLSPSPPPQSLQHVRTMSSSAHLDPVFLSCGIVMEKEIVMTALMNLPLVVSKHEEHTDAAGGRLPATSSADWGSGCSMLISPRSFS